jgi:hypothetical protein
MLSYDASCTCCRAYACSRVWKQAYVRVLPVRICGSRPVHACGSMPMHVSYLSAYAHTRVLIRTHACADACFAIHRCPAMTTDIR